MRKPVLFTLPLFTLLLALLAAAPAPARPASLNAQLQPYLKKYNLPALAAAVVKDGKIVAAGAVGSRRAGQDIPVTINDRFHLGSDTKAMSALLAAMAVERGLLRWDSTPGQVFPELAATMDHGFRDLTLERLLSHTSGLPADNEEFMESVLAAEAGDGNLDEMRARLLAYWSKKPLASAPGQKFQYSNLGYTIAGAMVERAYGSTWEELICGKIFDALGLASAGLGPQSSLGRVDAPLPHRIIGGKLKPVLAGPDADNPALIGPAGTAHMSILDFARWAGWNAGQGRRRPSLISAAAIKKLQTPVADLPAPPRPAPGRPPGGRYGLGWGQLTVGWAPRPLVYHGGSNTRNIAQIWLDPAQDLAIVTAVNVAGPKADAALFALAPLLYKEFSGK